VVFDEAYRKELNKIFGKKEEEDLRSQYGITLEDGTIVGYRLGNDRYGSMSDLKDLITAASEKGLKIIVDTVFNHVSPDHGASSGKRWWKDQKSETDQTIGISDLRVIQYNRASKTFSISSSNFPADFFHELGTGQYVITTWDWGPDLNTGNANVQEMVFKHLKILSDLDVTGIRFDAMKHIAPMNSYKFSKKHEAL
jgi:glycosidase